MRRTIYPLIAAVALLGIAVTPALARQHDHRAHERRHHERRRHERVHHHLRIRHRTFGSAEASGPSSSATGTDTSGGDTAGTVASFTNGVLTIALHNGSTVSGAVTPATEIECRSTGAQNNENGDDNDAAENAGDEHHGDGSSGGESSRGDDSSEGSNDQGDDRGDQQRCDSGALQAGTVVSEARLTLRSSGASWDKVELLSAAFNGSAASDAEDS
jgi:hypothetical protein